MFELLPTDTVNESEEAVKSAINARGRVVGYATQRMTSKLLKSIERLVQNV